MTKFEKFATYIAPPILWMVVIFIFSSYPTVKTSEVYINEFIIKKSAHIIEYGVLAILIFRAFKNTTNLTLEKSKIYSVVVATLYGITDELHQMFTPGRTPNIRDVFFDFLGAWLGVFLITNLIQKPLLWVLISKTELKNYIKKKKNTNLHV